MSVSKSATLAVFRRVMQVARKWPTLVEKESRDHHQTLREVAYIKAEARDGFRANREMTDPADIGEKLQTALDRMDIAVHYKIPYPKHKHLVGYNPKPSTPHSKPETRNPNSESETKKSCNRNTSTSSGT
ncbi:hypothetical protein T484DRAFT_2970085 [Baffinella frigidus]|nr:hypothetical protein T484DRAFT_2970085 [Cryptophyta sp. CCMP2293]